MPFGDTQGGIEWVQTFSSLRGYCSENGSPCKGVVKVAWQGRAALKIQVSHRVHVELGWGRERK